MEKFVAYLKAQLDKVTAWIGMIGVLLYITGFHGLLFLLFIALIILPEAQFSETFKKWTQKIREWQP